MPLIRDVFSDGLRAHAALRGKVTAAHFTEGVVKRVCVPVADLCLSPGGRLDRQILLGHPVRQLDPESGPWRDESSGYVGLLSPSDLADWREPTHRVVAPRSFLFAEPDFKTPAPVPVSANSLLTIVARDGRYARTADGHWAVAGHLAPVDEARPDLAAIAATLCGTPYLWGGNSAFGIDCSGLVQLACETALLACPGDSDQQMAALGVALPPGTPPMRGDLMFWRGHVALLRDPETLIHANAHHMAVATEPLAEAIARISAQGDGLPLVHKRLGPAGSNPLRG